MGSYLLRNSTLRLPVRAVVMVLVVTALALVAFMLVAKPAQAATTFTVTKTDDTNDGACTADDCSLRDAIIAANNAQGPDTIKFNIPGSGVQRITVTGVKLPDITDPVTIDGTTQPGFAGAPIIEVKGANAGDGGGNPASGLLILSGNSTVRGLIISSFTAHGIELRTNGGNVIEGNYIGTDASGNAVATDPVLGIRGNNGHGILVGSSNNTIGGTADGARNVVSGNGKDGIRIEGAGVSGNKVEGNYVGIGADGTTRLGNYVGVHITGGGSSNAIGGTADAERNVVSGNNLDGVLINDSGNNSVQGNYIGTNAAGTARLGNTASGVASFGSPGTVIGGTTSGMGNVISGNSRHGIFISGGSDSKVQGNYVGTDKNNIADLGNGIDGVEVNNSSNVFVGGTEAGAGNTFAFNARDGVRISSPASTGNAILANSIFSNTGLGINLVGGTEDANGVTANDDKDADTGPNNLQNYPALASASSSSSATTIKGTLNSTPGKTFTVQFFSSPEKDPSGNGEGKSYLGQTTVTTDNTGGNADFSLTATQAVPAGQFVTATATSPTNDTSEFSSAVAVIADKAPVAKDDPDTPGDPNYATDEDKTLTVDAPGVLANDTDPDKGDTLMAVKASDPKNGELTLNPDGSFTYTPNKDFNGTDSFTYKAEDSSGTDSSPATVTITVNPVNDAPVAKDDSATTDEDTATTPIDVLSNDTDVDGDPLSVGTFTNGSHGTVTKSTDGKKLIYTPEKDFNGTDTFTYKATDGSLNSNDATVTVKVNPVNDPPDAKDDSVSTMEDTPVTIPVLDNDSDVDKDTLTVTKVSDPAHGTATINSADNTIKYQPAANFNGPDSFQYTVSDGNGGTATATVSINVVPVNDAPIANDDAYSTDEGQTLTTKAPGVLLNDVDAEGDELMASVVSNPKSGTLTFNPDGSFSYEPGANFSGTDSFTYKASDGTNESNEATVTITVKPVNGPPSNPPPPPVSGPPSNPPPPPEHHKHHKPNKKGQHGHHGGSGHGSGYQGGGVSQG